MGERAAVERVEPEPVDQVHHGTHLESVVTDRGHGDAVGRAGSAWVVIELVVAELIQSGLRLLSAAARGSPAVTL